MLKIAVCVDLSRVGRREGGMVQYCCQSCCRGDGREQGSLGSEDDTVPGAETPAPPVCLLGRGRRHSTHLWGSGSALGPGVSATAWMPTSRGPRCWPQPSSPHTVSCLQGNLDSSHCL